MPTKANVLIDQMGCPRLSDSGLLTIISDPTYLLSSSSHIQGGTARWMSPERIAPGRFGFKHSRPTRHSDCYALGMVIYETISGHLPFHKDAELTVFMKVVEGKRPLRGARFTDRLWEMVEQCWAPRPDARPSVEDVLQCLETEPPSTGQDVKTEEDGGDVEMKDGTDGWDSDNSFCKFSHSIPPAGPRSPFSCGHRDATLLPIEVAAQGNHQAMGAFNYNF